jgi:uncharacterized protein (DUF302 family)
MSKLTSLASSYDFDETVARVESELAQREIPVFARIDHAQNARDAGLEMPATLVLVFGAARGGTPVMQSCPDIAYELPLRLLVRQGEAGVEVLFRPIDDLMSDYHVVTDVAAPLHLVEKVAAAATAQSA